MYMSDIGPRDRSRVKCATSGYPRLTMVTVDGPSRCKRPLVRERAKNKGCEAEIVLVDQHRNRTNIVSRPTTSHGCERKITFDVSSQYEIQDMVGEGSYGVVCSAFHKPSTTPCCAGGRSVRSNSYATSTTKISFPSFTSSVLKIKTASRKCISFKNLWRFGSLDLCTPPKNANPRVACPPFQRQNEHDSYRDKREDDCPECKGENANRKICDLNERCTQIRKRTTELCAQLRDVYNSMTVTSIVTLLIFVLSRLSRKSNVAAIAALDRAKLCCSPQRLPSAGTELSPVNPRKRVSKGPGSYEASRRSICGRGNFEELWFEHEGAQGLYGKKKGGGWSTQEICSVVSSTSAPSYRGGCGSWRSSAGDAV